jgi:hypothetical protein
MLNKTQVLKLIFEIKALKLKSGLSVLKIGVLDLENEM